MTTKSMEQYGNPRAGKDVTIEDGAEVDRSAILGDHVVIRRGAVIGANTILGYRDPVKNEGDNLLTEIGRNSIVRSGSVVYAGTRIGDRSAIGHNCVLRERTIVGHDTYIGTLSCVEGDTIIGNYVGIQSHCYITKYCDVGDFTFIAPCFSGANDMAMTHRRAGHGHNLIGFSTDKYVRIATGVIVLPGVHFGEGCIAAAGSVVTRDVPPYMLVMGIPARIVREASRDEVVVPATTLYEPEDYLVQK